MSVRKMVNQLSFFEAIALLSIMLIDILKHPRLTDTQLFLGHEGTLIMFVICVLTFIFTKERSSKKQREIALQKGLEEYNKLFDMDDE